MDGDPISLNPPPFQDKRPTTSSKTIQKCTHSFSNPSYILFVIVVASLLIGGAQAKLTIAKKCGDFTCKPHSYCSQIDHSCQPCQVACDRTLGNFDEGVCERECQDYLHDQIYMRRPENESDFHIDLFVKVQEDLRLLKILIGVVIILSTVVMLALFCIMIYFRRLRNRLQQEGLMHDNPFMMNTKKQLSDYPVIYSNSKVLSLPLPNIHKGPPSDKSNNSSINNNLSRSSSPDLVSRTITTITSYHNNSLKGASGGGNNGNKDKNNCGFIMENPMAKPSELKEKQSRLKKEPSESTLPDYHAYDNPALVSSPVHHTHM